MIRTGLLRRNNHLFLVTGVAGTSWIDTGVAGISWIDSFLPSPRHLNENPLSRSLLFRGNKSSRRQSMIPHMSRRISWCVKNWRLLVMKVKVKRSCGAIERLREGWRDKVWAVRYGRSNHHSRSRRSIKSENNPISPYLSSGNTSLSIGGMCSITCHLSNEQRPRGYNQSSIQMRGIHVW